MSKNQADNNISPETYEFGLLQRLKHEFEPQGLKVCGTENGEKHYARGRFSRALRQLDVAVYRPGENAPFFLADAKRHKRKVDVKRVECFIGMMDDINANIGLLVAPNGFSKAAARRAKAANLTIKIMSSTEALEFQWLPFARSIYPWDWIFHLELSSAVKYLKEGAKPEFIIDALEGIAFDEWEAFVEYALVHHHEEAVQMLETIAVNHIDDGWRYNATWLLWECSDLNESLIEVIKSTERDHEILEFVQLYCGKE
jgi:hypothetical protein